MHGLLRRGKHAVHHVCRTSAVSNTSTVLYFMFRMLISSGVFERLATICE